MASGVVPVDSLSGDQELDYRGLCAHCEKKAKQDCAKCGKYFCSKEHWKVHQKPCSKKHKKLLSESSKSKEYYKLLKESSKPTVMVASKNIPCGTEIFKSQAISVGPNGSQPVCLGCLRPIIYDVMSYLCEGCGWPLCGVDCEHSELHQLECQAMQNAGYRFNAESLRNDWRTISVKSGAWIIVLRVLLSGKSEELLKFFKKEGVNDFEKTDQTLLLTVHLIRNELKLSQFKPEDIMQLGSIVKSNLWTIAMLQDGVHISVPRVGAGFHASDLIYAQHSCNPNVEYIYHMQNPADLILRASTDIKAGQILSAYRENSIPCITSTYSRQLFRNMRGKGPCKCQRCFDPSEMGLYLSSLLCNNCKGMVVPMDTANILQTDWICKACKLVMKGEEFFNITVGLFNKLAIAVASDKKDKITNIEQFIQNHSGPSGVLHGNHEMILQAKRNYCVAIQDLVIKKDRFLKLDSRELSNFSQYVRDFQKFHYCLNQKVIYETFALNLIFLKNALFQLSRGKITKEQAIAQMNGAKKWNGFYGYNYDITSSNATVCICSRQIMGSASTEYVLLYNRLLNF